MAAVAVTGGSGFIGNRLIERLCQHNLSVRALSRKSSIQRPIGGDTLRVIQGSLNDDTAIRNLLDGVDAVIHLAGLIKARHRRAFFEVNEDGVRHLANIAAANKQPPKLVLISSLAAREPALSSYAASKRAGEKTLSADGSASPLPWTILRPPAVYGPGDLETLPFFKGAKRGIGAMLGSEHARFSLIHVDDLVDLILAVLRPEKADHQVLEPDDGQEGGHSWHGMIDTAERAFGTTVIRVPIPKPLLMALGYANASLRILPGYTPMLTPEKVRELTHLNWVADACPALHATGWKPSITIDRGFAATIHWYQLHSLL